MPAEPSAPLLRIGPAGESLQSRLTSRVGGIRMGQGIADQGRGVSMAEPVAGLEPVNEGFVPGQFAGAERTGTASTPSGCQSTR